jgi:4-amino-4-deoxy-L-arabinose transferase-like glycosyltransferase
MNDRQDHEGQYIHEERILRRIPLKILGFSLVFACVGLFLFSPRTSLFILAGGAISATSFLWLKQTIAWFLGQDRKKAIKSGILFYLIRLLLIIGVFSIIIFLFPRMILAFAAGFSSIILAIFIEAVMAISEMKQWKS